MIDLAQSIFRTASRLSLRRGRVIWVEYRAGRLAMHLAHRRGWNLIVAVAGDEPLAIGE